MRNEIKLWLKVIVIAILVQPLYSLASNIGTLTSFTAGTPIQSAQVNGNFAAITTAVNSKQDAITGTCPTGQAISGVAAVGGALTCAPAGLAFGAVISGSSAPDSGVTVVNSGSGAAIEGDNSNSAGSGGYGVLGQITATIQAPYHNNTSVGVMGENRTETLAAGAFAAGVWGDGTGVGVYGSSAEGIGVSGSVLSAVPGSAGVQAYNGDATGVALSIQQGYFQVAGAGANTSTTVFTVALTGGGTTPAESDFSNPMTNGNPNLILFVVPNFGGSGVDTHAAAPYYDTTGKWGIYNIDGSAMPAGAGFTVLVIDP